MEICAFDDGHPLGEHATRGPRPGDAPAVLTAQVGRFQVAVLIRKPGDTGAWAGVDAIFVRIAAR